MNNPGSILKLWVKTVAPHESDKDPKTLPKKGQEQKPKIKKGLTFLKVQGAADMAVPDNPDKFIALRDRVGLVMTRYCRYLKAARDEDKKDLPKYLKTVTRLTALVLKLDPGNLSLDEEEPSLESLEGVDVTAVEQAMAAPDTDDDLDLDAPAQTAPPATTKPPAPAGDGRAAQTDAQVEAARARLKSELKTLMAKIQPALAAHPKRKQELLQLVKDFEQRLPHPGNADGRFPGDPDRTVATAEKALDVIRTVFAALDQPKDDSAAQWAARREEVEPRLLAALKGNHPNATQLRAAFAFATEKAEAGDVTTALTALDNLDKTLSAPTGANGAATPAPTGKVALELFRVELRQVRLQAIKGVNQLIAQLQASGAPKAQVIIEIIKKLAVSMPVELEPTLQLFEAAVEANDAAGVAKVRGDVQRAVKGWMDFLKSNAKPIAGCENNPWGTEVRLADPVRNSLKSILSAVSR